jgi:hypothetical protein
LILLLVSRCLVVDSLDQVLIITVNATHYLQIDCGVNSIAEYSNYGLVFVNPCNPPVPGYFEGMGSFPKLIMSRQIRQKLKENSFYMVC